MPHLKFIKIV